jgi:hypothetical protein
MLETLADGLALSRLRPLPFAQAAVMQVSVELGQVLDGRHRRAPFLLQELHTPLDAWLLLGPPHHAEQGLEVVMTGQGLVASADLPLPAHEDIWHQRGGIIPPDLVRHAAEELECLDQTVQDRLGPLGGQGDGEGAIRVGPGHEQDRHLPAAVGKIDVHMTKIRFESLARIVIQRNERLASLTFLAAHIEANALIAASEAVFLLEAPEQLHGRVPLFARRQVIVEDQFVQDALEGIEDRGQRFEPLIRFGFGTGDDLADLVARVMKRLRQ